MSIDREKAPVRFDSQATRVEVEEDPTHTHDGCSEKAPRFSFNQASPPDNPYNPVRGLKVQSRIFNLPKACTVRRPYARAGFRI